MDIAITGAGGFIGRALTASLTSDGHRVIPVVRRAAGPDEISWDPAAGTIDAAAFEGLDAVVHLAGEGVAAGPWTAKQRARIRDSRRDGTTLLAGALAGLDRPPATLVSGSAIGFYGDRGDQILTEQDRPAADFLAQVCVAWEDATAAAAEAGLRVATIRTGIVLARGGGMMAKLLPLYKLGLGGRAGRGDQWMSWIHLTDEVRAIRHLVDHTDLHGPFNLTAPQPVTNAEFTDELGTAVRRPTFFTVPRLAAKAPFGIGPLVDNLLFSSARAEPAALTASGFEFTHPTLPGALAAVVEARS